jgi:CRISPR/Cas system CSM-associated protein Csm3 (group 7 of RAMP superfamily)
MARLIAQRIKVKGELITQSPLHVGGMSLNPTVDLSLALDGQGRYYIPGTSLAGAFRQWMSRNFEELDMEQLWGYQTDDRGHASFVLIEDAYFSNVLVELRDGVGINRQTGAAAEKTKFDRAIIPKGASCNLEMSVEIRADDYFGRDLDILLNALCAGDIRLGAAKTRGLGRVKLENCQKLTQTLNTKAGMLQALQDNFSPNYLTYEPQESQQKSELHIHIKWQPIGAVMVKDAIAGNAVDMLPLTSVDGECLALVIPGSSIKGALRSQAERIVRTVIQQSTPSHFLEQVKVPIVEDLFGSAANKNDQSSRQGALFVEDCYSQQPKGQPLSTEAWQNVIRANTQGALIAALRDANLPSVQQSFHVAIDRWTGGASDGMLYSNLEPFNMSWSEIELTVDFCRLAERKLPAIALLLLLLRDLCQRRIPLGYGANRGMGSIKIDNIQIKGQGLEEDALTDFNLSIDESGLFEGVPQMLLETVNQSWQDEIALNRGEST